MTHFYLSQVTQKLYEAVYNLHRQKELLPIFNLLKQDFNNTISLLHVLFSIISLTFPLISFI